MEDRRHGPGGLLVHLGATTTPLPRGEWVLGRGPEADIRIDDDRVSRRHAVVRWGPDGWELADGGSLNGIWSAGRQLQHVPVPPGGVTVLVGGRDGVPVRLVPVRAAAPDAAVVPADGGTGAAPVPLTSPVGVRFEEVTPQWTGWERQPPAVDGPGGVEAGTVPGRLRAFVRHAVDAARPKGRRED